jgi:type VI protein secretion system component VasK
VTRGLRQRYFDDYASAWQQFLNGIRWQPTPKLSGTVDQLTLLGDPQRSPLVTLMRVVVYQAGAGATTQSLSDTLVTKAQQLVGADEKDPSKIVRPQNLAPLAPAFGPLLRLAGNDVAAGLTDNGNAAGQMAATGDLSLARFLERVTAMRLKLQQITMSSDPDAMVRAAAQAVLQGKTSDIADSRDYASRVSASLGEQWAGFGDLFEQPLGQTWQVVLQPAAASLWPANAEQAHDLLPGARVHGELMAFLRLYVGTKADVFLRMEVSSKLVPAPRIGSASAGPAPRLSWTTVLPSENEQMITIPLGCYEVFPAFAPNPYLDPALTS